MPRFMRLFSLALLVVTLAGAKDRPAGKPLPQKLQGIVQKIEAAYTAGDVEGAWHVLAPAVAKQNDDIAEAFDQALEAKGLPKAAELLVQARLKLLVEGRTTALPAPALRERLLVLEALQPHIDGPLGEVAGDAAVREAQEAPPQSMAEFDQRFRELQRLGNKVRMGEACARYAVELAAKLPNSARGKLTDEQKAILAHCGPDLVAEVGQSAQMLREQELGTRLQRLSYGIEQLQKPELTEEKFIAAATTRQDSRVLIEALSPPPDSPATAAKSKGAGKGAVATAAATTAPAAPVFKSPALSKPDLLAEVQAQKQQAEQLAGPLGEKSERFFVGLEFWLRGRYGRGTELGGLAKSSAALKRPELLWQVNMPEELPNVSMAADPRRQQVTHLDRLHHYIWAWEDRKLVTKVAAMPERRTYGRVDYDGLANYLGGTYGYTGKGATGAAEWKEREIVKTVDIPPQDPRLVYRIVGFIEYGRAVEELDKFVGDATIAELDVAEKIIRAQDPFIIETNISRRTEAGSTLTEQSPNPRDDFQRHGLPWMLALARVELGAMLAGFTSQANPFLSMAPQTQKAERVQSGPYGGAEFAEILLDALRTHYWAIMREDVVQNYYKQGVPEDHLVTYSRRAVVGRELLKAVVQYYGSAAPERQLNAAQLAELKTWEQAFEKVQRVLLYCLSLKTGQERTVHYRRLAAATSISGSNTQSSPKEIARLLLTIDPTLAACPCK